jgi:hypothetical protein
MLAASVHKRLINLLIVNAFYTGKTLENYEFARTLPYIGLA